MSMQASLFQTNQIPIQEAEKAVYEATTSSVLEVRLVGEFLFEVLYDLTRKWVCVTPYVLLHLRFHDPESLGVVVLIYI